MKFKIDENLPSDLVPLLLAKGYEVDTVFSEGLQGADDQQIYRKINEESSMLITSDLGFSDIRHYPIGTNPGIILIRLTLESKERILGHFAWILEQYDLDTFSNSLVIISDHKIRIKR